MRVLGCVWWTRMRWGGWKVWEKNQENELEREEEGIFFLGKWGFWVVYGEWECEGVEEKFEKKKLREWVREGDTEGYSRF